MKITPKEAAVLRCMMECDFIQDHADSPEEWASIGCPIDEVADRYAEVGFSRDGLGGVVRSLVDKGLVDTDTGRKELFFTDAGVGIVQATRPAPGFAIMHGPAKKDPAACRSVFVAASVQAFPHGPRRLILRDAAGRTTWVTMDPAVRRSVVAALAKEESGAAVARLDALTNADPESARAAAEDMVADFLREIGAGEVADAFGRAANRVGFWYA